MEGKILILGGSGFIGTHLLKRCIHEGLDCVCVSLKNTNNSQKSKNVNYLKLDINNYSKVKELLGGKEFDYIVNLAGYVDHSQKIKTIKSHYNGCKNLADYLKSLKKKCIRCMGYD